MRGERGTLVGDKSEMSPCDRRHTWALFPEPVDTGKTGSGDGSMRKKEGLMTYRHESLFPDMISAEMIGQPKLRRQTDTERHHQGVGVHKNIPRHGWIYLGISGARSSDSSEDTRGLFEESHTKISARIVTPVRSPASMPVELRIADAHDPSLSRPQAR